MRLIEYFTNANITDVGLTLKCVLDRIPILIVGNNDSEIENFLNELAMLVPFRTQMIFYTDFVEKEDYLDLLENESNDYNTQRNLFLCYPFALEKVIESMDHFQSWLVGCSIESATGLEKIQELLYHKVPHYLTVILTSTSMNTQIEGKSLPQLNITFEKSLYQKAIQHTEIAVEKMKRVIAKKINLKKIPPEIYQNLMNFAPEEKELKLNLIKKEIIDFYQACKRTSNILTRMQGLKQYGLNPQISSKTLNNTIAYDQAPIERILSFVEAEWQMQYNHILQTKKTENFLDTFESLWG